jgi:MYXO-CTERM domain-containing protein
VWVSDQSPNVNGIFRYDLSGNYLGTVGGADGGLSNVRGLRYIDGTVYAVNAGTTNGAPGPSIVSISSAGAILGSFSTAAVGGTIGASPWDVMRYDGRFLVSDGTSRALQLYNADGTYHGALTGPLNNIPQQMFLRANGNVLLAASGSTPTNSFGVYELGTDGAVVAQWTGTPGLGARGVYELGNGRYLVSESGGSSASRGLGTIDPTGPQNNTNFQLIQGLWNGGWISPLQVGVTTVPEPTAAVLLVPALAGLAAARRRRRS